MRLALLLLLLAFVAVACAPSPGVRWNRVLEFFNLGDQHNPPLEGSVLFIGSSSIHRWLTASDDFPDVFILNRGVSGSQLSELRYYVEQLVLPYAPRLIVLYAGENDLARGKTPEAVLGAYQDFVQRVREHNPEQRIVFLTIKPSPRRSRLLPRIRRANALIATHTLHDPHLDYLDVSSSMLDDQGRVRHELFVRDGVHLSPAGYALWRELLTPYLLGVLGPDLPAASLLGLDAEGDAP